MKGRQQQHTQRNRSMDTLPGGYLTQREADWVENSGGYASYACVETVYDRMFQEIFRHSSSDVEDRLFFMRGREEKQWDFSLH